MDKFRIIEEMQQAAGDGHIEHASDTWNRLHELTSDLRDTSGAESAEEYDRFVAVKNRHLTLDYERTEQLHAGKNILITGGTGCIGSALVRKLVELNPASITSISRGMTSYDGPVPGVRYLNEDIRSSDGLRSAVGSTKPDMIYHLAAQRDPGLAEQQVGHTLATNILGTRNVLDAARGNDVGQIIYASTGKALRPFTPDAYAASKKAGEWLMSDSTKEGSQMRVSGVRFTHVVDNSIIHQRLKNWAEADEPVRLHAPNIMFYMQSANESADLLMNSAVEAEPGNFDIHAIRDLEWPINLTDLALGGLVRMKSNSAIHYVGFEQGYEEMPYPALYDPAFSGELSPLINGLEGPQARESAACSQVDAFSLTIGSRTDPAESIGKIEQAIRSGASNEDLKGVQDELSWNMLDDRLAVLPREVLNRSATIMQRYPDFDKLPPEHKLTADAIERALQRGYDR